MAKGKYSRLHGKKWSTITLVLFMLFMLSLVLLMLLALGIVSLPISSDDSPPNDLSSFRRRIVTRYGVWPIWWFYVLWVSDSQCVFDLWVKIDFFFFNFYLAGVKDWERGRSSGLKFFHGSPGLSFITISWFVKFYVLFLVVLFWYGIRNLDVFVGLYYEILMWLLVHYGFSGFDFKILSEGLGGEFG